MVVSYARYNHGVWWQDISGTAIACGGRICPVLTERMLLQPDWTKCSRERQRLRSGVYLPTGTLRRGCPYCHIAHGSICLCVRDPMSCTGLARSGKCLRAMP
eukprot:2294957-Rhodomonas_salina.2